MCTNVNHNYGVPAGGIPPLLAVPLAGPVEITIKDLNGKLFGETTAHASGLWRDTFCLNDGTYIVEFTGAFRPIGSGFKSIFTKPVTSISVTIVIPLTSEPDLEPPDTEVGPPGEVGATGPEGPQGEPGIDGISIVGPVGPAGVNGVPGADGINGIDGAKGALGSVGPRGAPGPIGVQGRRGIPGTQGPAGITGDACDINIGVPSDGYITDGLLAWLNTTKVCDALDDINEILSEIVPDTPLSLVGESLAMTGVTLYNGNASDKIYQNYKSAAGESVDGTYTGGKIVLSDTFTLTNPTTGDSEAGGDDTFYPGDEGSLSSIITESGLEVKQGIIDLASGSPIYDSSLTLNAQNAGYNNFNLWVRGDATIDANTYISSGYNKFIMRHSVNGSDRDSADYEVFYDNEPLTQTAAVTTVGTESSPAYRELSGIRSYTTSSTFVVAGTYTNMFNNTYQTDAFNYENSLFPGTADATISLASAAWNGTISSPVSFDDVAILSGAITTETVITVADQRSTNARVSMVLKKPGRSDLTDSETSVNRLVDTFSDSSTVLDDPFDDENYRQPDYVHDSVPTSLTGNWDSSVDLIDGEAVIFHGSLYHGSSSNLPGGGDFTGRVPIGPDYSGFTADAIYVRAFEDDGDPHNSGILELVGLTASDVSPVGSGNVNVEIKLPTETGWLDLGTTFNVATFTGIDGDGCQTAQSGDDWSFSFGSFSTADSEFTIIVRVTILDTTSVISRIRITDW